MTVPDDRPSLTISLFGPMQVLVEGRPLPRLRSRKSLALLALLALRGGRPLAREWLAGMLWPDADQDLAAASLRPALSELRRALGDQAGCLRSPNQRTLCLETAHVDIDVLRFDAAIKAGTEVALATAVSLYRGPLLEGSTEEWVAQEREAREQDCLRALMILAESALGSGDNARAADHFRRAIALDPWRDGARRGLMEALAREGNRNAALQVYREFVALLREDPRAAPDDQTTALYQSLRSEARQVPRTEEKGPSKAEPGTRGYLPHPLTDLVGREGECLEVRGLLHHSRLVTLTGPGGIGKTRLALAVAEDVADEFVGGAWLVSLETLFDGEQLPARVAGALGLKDAPGGNALETLVAPLRDQRMLLVLDNCEHLLEASARLAAHLLRECAGLRILATSREALRVAGETLWAVPGLTAADGVRLFVERAHAAHRGFALTDDNAPNVAQVCARLEGIPLALELAAARVRAVTVEQMVARLDDHLDLLTGGDRSASSRQQTLRATLDWSYALLSVSEQLLLARVSVFSSGWDLEAAEAVCAGEGLAARQILDLLTGLVDRSLVRFEEHHGGGRYRPLEMVRQYARERLGVGDAAALVQNRHRDFFLALAEASEPEMKGPHPETWLRRLEAERDNLRVALEWCETDAAGSECGLRLASALFPFWALRSEYTEGRSSLQRALAGSDIGGALRGKALKGAARLADRQGDYKAARTLYEEALGIFRGLADDVGIASTLGDLGDVAGRQGDTASARAFYEEARKLYQEDLSPTETSDNQDRILNNLAILAANLGDYAAAKALFAERLDNCRRRGDRPASAGELNNLGFVCSQMGDDDAARTALEQSRDLFRDLGDKRIVLPLYNLAWLARRQGDFAAALAASREMLAVCHRLADRAESAKGLEGVAAALLGRADSQALPPPDAVPSAVRLWGAAQSLRETIAVSLPAEDTDEYAPVVAQARTLLGEAAFTAAWAEGRALTWEQAVTSALQD